ncbi:hypothetical protein evm_004242 [Chilo suppressalis]|nr:hypothetical protein evm_004242 [Chilo suppressalis]
MDEGRILKNKHLLGWLFFSYCNHNQFIILANKILCVFILLSNSGDTNSSEILKMKTIFMSSENINKRKKYQKPNILRKKPSGTVSSKTKDVGNINREPSDTSEASNGQLVSEPNLTLDFSNILKPVSHHLENDLNHDHKIGNKFSNENLTTSHVITESGENVITNNDDPNHTMVNIEAFFNDTPEKNVMLYDIDCEPGNQIETIMVIDDKSPVSEVYIQDNPDLITNMVPLSTVISQEEQEEVVTLESPQNNNMFSATLRKFMCDAPNCKKEFRSEQKLQEHKKIHNEDGTIKPARQVTVECPVKKLASDGTEVPCGRVFLVRHLLLKHLNEDHKPEDASYGCDVCARRFFWASGLGRHARVHCSRGASPPALVCGWSGCGRVFRLPCRLREHARAHTGDRPYRCQYPNCEWSFRSASKLERHARRHTGERRHACELCARAFLRREHLRDHHARHHAPRRRPHACTHPGCEQTFNNMSTLYMHLKKVHRSKDVNASETATTGSVSLPQLQEENGTFLVNLVSSSALVRDSTEAGLSVEAGVKEIVDGVEVNSVCGAEASASGVEMSVDIIEQGSGVNRSEWRAARTHCTWPLSRTNPTSPAPEAHLDDDYVVSFVEQTENSDSNIYTVRSDLFLHGNIMINDDNEQSASAVGGTNDALETDLGMLDAHPTGDLMQEELMYTDVAADESSFRIFLLSGEELT